MESQNELNEKILLITMKIQENFPELTKYLGEMPENALFVTQKGIDAKDLKVYLDSLNELLETYSKEHQ